MTYSDDDLDRLFRAANPSPLRESSSRLSAADIAVREGIIRGTYRVPGKARERRPRWVWAGVATAFAVVIFVAAGVLVPTQRAVALTPPPLVYTPAGSLADVIDDAEERLQSPPDVPQESSVRSVVWGWSADLAEQRVEIVPQEISFDWAPGQTAEAVIVAGDSLWSENDLPKDVHPSPYEPGEIIDTVLTPPEDFTLAPAAANLRGSTREDLMAALLSMGATEDSSSGELFAAITGLLQYWTLDDDQHATLLQMLVDAGGVTVRGETTDRVGRDVIGLQVSSVIPERVETVFVSTRTGRIVGMESELLEPLQGLPAGVITYKMWDVDTR